jgi:hypothetical protein
MSSVGALESGLSALEPTDSLAAVTEAFALSRSFLLDCDESLE